MIITSSNPATKPTTCAQNATPPEIAILLEDRQLADAVQELHQEPHARKTTAGSSKRKSGNGNSINTREWG